MPPPPDPPADAGRGEDRILTVPNALSLGRLACVPLFLWLLFGRENRLAAALLLAVLGTTDWVDGYIARHFNQVSTVGKVLDPVADRVLLLVAVFAILADGSVPAWVAWLAIVREAAVGGGVLVLAALGAQRIDVQLAGKAGTFLLMMTFPLFLASHHEGFSWSGEARAAAWICAIAGLIFAYVSAVRYVPLGRDALRAGRAGRAPRSGRIGSGR